MKPGHELSIDRLIDAPPATVYKVWTERLEEWWAPRPWTTRIVEQDLRPGGRSAMVMTGPDGETSEMEGVVLEVVPNEKIVFTNAFSAGWVPQKPFMVGIFAFADEGGKTRYTASSRHWDAETQQRHEAMGFYDGWRQVADQLAEIAEAEAAKG